ncbi:MAG: Mu transposase C-terminal domain-containing protein [Anaerolineae bacterium]|nr:Mu transposase C-terminal domain-containing protein [Anaerolineae bacterium]
MSRIQIKTGSRYVQNNQIHVIHKCLTDHRYQIENLSTGSTSIRSYDDLLEAWSNGALRFEITSPNAVSDGEVALYTRYKEDDLADLPSHLQEETWRRYQLLLQLYRFADVRSFQTLTRSQIEAFITAQGWQTETSPKRAKLGQAVSAGSLERYLQVFVESGGDIRSLIPQTQQQGGKGKTRLEVRVEQIIETVLAEYSSVTIRISTVDQIVTDIVNRIGDENRFREKQDQLKLPSESTIRRRIRTAGEKRILGRRLSRREQQSESDVQPGPRSIRILERVEIDHTTLDLFVVDETDGLPIGRPHITACIDKYSGLVPGWHVGFNHGGYESIMLCLQHAFLPKPDYRKLYGTQHDYPVYGLFEKLCVDRGQDFTSRNLQNALAELGIIREEMPAETPWFKGSIERYFRSVNQQLLKGKPGYTFGSVMQLGDYEAQKDAVISLSGFLEIFHLFMVDIYPYKWHRGLEAVPMERWQESRKLYQPDLCEDAVALKRILLPSAERTLQTRGIEWECNFYRGSGLARLREHHGSKKVRFKYNPDNMDEIYVRDRSAAGGWVTFHSVNPEYTWGLSLDKHRIIRQYVAAEKLEVNRFTLARAKAHIQQVVEREFLNTRKLRHRSKLKPLREEPPPPAETKLVVLPKPKTAAQTEEFSPDLTGWSVDYGLPFHSEQTHE